MNDNPTSTPPQQDNQLPQPSQPPAQAYNQATPQQPAPPTPVGQPMPQQQAHAPLAPIDISKSVRNGWIFFGAGIVVTIVGMILGYALVASAILFAIAGRLGLQSKNKGLAITGITFALLAVALFIFASATSR